MKQVSARILSRKLSNLVIGVLIAGFALVPILWGLSTSLKKSTDILRIPPEIIPSSPTLEHYVYLFQTGIGQFIMNSVVVSAATVAVCLAVGAVAGYALARFHFFGRGLVMLVIIAVMSIPIASLLVPTYTLVAAWGLLNTRTALVLLYVAYQLPIVVWILYAYFETLPVELEHAARIDGYGRLATLWKVVLPLSGPGLVAAGLFVLTFAWNDFVVALVITSVEQVRTLPVAIYFYLGFFGREWGPLTAAAMVSIVPIIAVFIFFQKYFLSGMTGGSIKG